MNQRFSPLLLVPLAGLTAALLGALALVVGAGGVSGPAAEDDAREVRVAAVVSNGPHEAGLVLLEAVDGEALMPVPVLPGEGDRIRAAEEGAAGGSSLLEEAVGALGGRIAAVILDDGGGDLTGRVIVEGGGDRLELEATAGEAIAAAIGAGRPLYSTERALSAIGITPEELEELHEGVTEPEGFGGGEVISM